MASPFVKWIKKQVRPTARAALNLLPPRLHIQLEYLRVYHRLPDLENPKTFSEKIMWRKLYERDPRLPDLTDKIRVKEIIAAKFGAQYIIPTLAVYTSTAEMDFSKPPLSTPPYVLKTNNASGTNLFVKKNSSLRPEDIRKQLDHFLKIDYSKVALEWSYTDITPKILVEPYIELRQGTLTDYKFHVFNGRTYAIEVILDRFGNRQENSYSRDWQPLNFVIGDYTPCRTPIPPPAKLMEMMTLAEAIGRDFSYVRVDLYEVDSEIKFGEMTFYPGGGHDRLNPIEWDVKFGEQWKLDTNR